MKIYFVSHSSEMAGAEQSLIRLIGSAIARGHTGAVSVPNHGPLAESIGSWASSQFVVKAVSTHRWMGQRSRGLAGFVRVVQCLLDVPRFLRGFQRARPDAVVVNTSVTPAPLVAAALLGIPVVTIMRETIASNPTLKSFLPKGVIKRVINRLSASVITVSKLVARQYEYPSVVIYPQIDPVFFAAASERKYHRSNNSVLRGVMMGYFTPEKGQVDAIQAVRYVHDAGIPMRLDLYGAGSEDYYRTIKEAIRAHELETFVTVHSPTNKVLDALRDADVSLICSRNEAFGKTTAESVLAGTPVVAYALGGTCEILDAGGGKLVEPSPRKLAEALVDLNTDPAAIRALTADTERAKNNLKERLENTASEIIAVIEGVVDAKY